jgi:hypothetical protein
MRYRACNQAHNAEVEIWVIFATRNSLKLHMMQKAVFHHEQRSCHNAKVVLADDGSSKRQASIDQSPRHRHTFPKRGFLHWRLSDDGPGASRIVPDGRHPKPFTN